MTKLTYKKTGVDVNCANHFVEQIKPITAHTQNDQVLNNLNGFSALFDMNRQEKRYQNPVLVSSTDGVGTKLKLTVTTNQYQSIGIDLVAMCVNDIITTGATPLFFLDYYATSKLEPQKAKQLIQGIADGCSIADIALVGGETAEMPGLYRQGDYDLAGFCVGVSEKSELILPDTVQAGNSLIALASSGPHANGYTLIRHILEEQSINLDATLAGQTLQEHLLTPTRIYVKAIKTLQDHHIPIHGIAHITGGGILHNLPRAFSKDLQAVINRDTWTIPPLFEWLQKKGAIATEEMMKTFNCGIGMILCIPAEMETSCLSYLNQAEETAWHLGHIDKKPQANSPNIVFQGKTLSE